MGISDFWGWNVILVGAGVLVILLYLIVLFQKRRGGKTNHSDGKK
jgi:hypothetical protein